MDTHIYAKYNSTLGQEECHMAGEIKRSRKPKPRRHIKLSTTLLTELGDSENSPIKRRRIQRNPIPNPPKVRQVKRHRPEPRQLPDGEGPPEKQDSITTIPLPEKHSEAEGDPEKSEKGFVGGEERRDPAAPPPRKRRRRQRLHHLSHATKFGDSVSWVLPRTTKRLSPSTWINLW